MKKPPAPSALPVSDKPVTLNFKAGATGGKPVVSLSAAKAPVSLPLGFSVEEFDPGDDETGPEPTAEDDKGFSLFNALWFACTYTSGSNCS